MADMSEFLVKNSAVFGPVVESSTAFTPILGSRAGPDRVRPLLELSAAAITKYQSLTQEALNTVPRELLSKLLKEALLRSHHLCIRDLISRWPWGSLDFNEIYGPQHRHHVLDLLNWRSGRAQIIVDSLLNCKSDALQVVDLRGALPNRKATVAFAEASLQSHRQRRANKDLHVYLNMWIEGRSVELAQNVECLSAQGTGIKLHPCQVVTVFVGYSLVKLMKTRLDPKVLTGLELKSEMFESASAFSTFVKEFPKLSALSLPNFPKRTLDSGGIQAVGEVLSHLPGLRRLNLNSLQVKGHLRQLLQDVQPLQHLNISHCRLSPSDIVFLSNSHHAKALQELSVSGMANFDDLCMLLKSVSQQLVWLDLSGCEKCFRGEFYYLMPRLIQQCTFVKLCTLDCRGNCSYVDSETTVCEVIEACDEIVTLQTLYIDAPYGYGGEMRDRQESAVLDILHNKSRMLNVQVQDDVETWRTLFKVSWRDTTM